MQGLMDCVIGRGQSVASAGLSLLVYSYFNKTFSSFILIVAVQIGLAYSVFNILNTFLNRHYQSLLKYTRMRAHAT